MGFFNFKNIFDIDFIFWLASIAVPAGILGLIVANPDNNYHTSSSDVNPNLRTRTYFLEDEGYIFCEKVENLIPALSTYGLNWKLVSSDCNPTKEIPYVIKAEVPVLFFTDDLEIRMRPSTDGEKIFVDVYSRSRIGKSDLGQNKRHIINLFHAMDEHFKMAN